MDFHGAYFSNYGIWLKDGKDYLGCAQIVLSLIHQDILNSDISDYYFQGYYFQGIHITSGIFQLWRLEGIITEIHLKYACTGSLIPIILALAGCYFHIHISWPTLSFYKKFKSLSIHHLSLLFGLSSISLSGHEYHISAPLNPLLDGGIDGLLMGCPQDLLFKDLIEIIVTSGGKLKLNSMIGHVFLGTPHSHHFYVGIVFITSSLIGFSFCLGINHGFHHCISSHGDLSMNLAITGSLSIGFAHHQNAIRIYPGVSDYPTTLCLFYHHMWVGSLLIIGGGTHRSLFIITDYSWSEKNIIGGWTLKGRDVLLSHLIWVTIGLGLHSTGIYIHNDTLEALSREEDILDDNSIQLKPVFAGKVLEMWFPRELGTGDFQVHHIHAFTIHLPLLILSKGILYARNSRFVCVKSELGFRYPCDGPGRGGTCQISPWDHIYLGNFWMYNSLSVTLFHYFWKTQSDVLHISRGDFSLNSSTINGWLRNFLWSQGGEVIQSYTCGIWTYGFIFISAHFIWAFSLMFLFSGRGYWQELIESILWGHHKLKIMVDIQPRALSISQGRGVGFIHYTLGGVGCTWSFFISRMVALDIS